MRVKGEKQSGRTEWEGKNGQSERVVTFAGIADDFFCLVVLFFLKSEFETR